MCFPSWRTTEIIYLIPYWEPAVGQTNEVTHVQVCGIMVVHHTVLNCRCPVLFPLVLPAKKLLTVLQRDYRREENTGVAILTDHSSLIQKMPVRTFHVLIIPRIFVLWYMNITVFCQGCPVIQSFEQRFVTEVFSKSACFFMEQS